MKQKTKTTRTTKRIYITNTKKIMIRDPLVTLLYMVNMKFIFYI